MTAPLCHPEQWSRTRLDRQIQRDLGRESPNPCKATARHAEVGCPGHDKSSSPHPCASKRNVGSRRRLPATGISVPNADRTQEWEVASLIPGRLRGQWFGVHRDRALGSMNCSAAVRRPGLTSQKSGSTPSVWSLGNRRHRGCMREGAAGHSISPSARARLTASARLCTPSFL
jgi:hypothetical protein